MAAEERITSIFTQSGETKREGSKPSNTIPTGDKMHGKLSQTSTW